MSALSMLAKYAEVLARYIANFMTAVSAVSVAAIVVVLTVSAAQRYVLTSPIAATEEVAAYLFVALAFTAMVGGMVEGRHIRLLPLWQRLPTKWQNWAMLVGHLGAIFVLSIIIRETFSFAWASYNYGARSYVADLIEWPWMMLIPGSLTLLAFAIAARAIVDLDRAIAGHAAPEATRVDEDEAI